MDDAEKLVELARSLIVAKKKEDLDYRQQAILKQALAGKRLKNICVPNQKKGYIQRTVAQDLWKLLSEVTGKKVGIKNLRFVLEEAASKVRDPEKPEKTEDTNDNTRPCSASEDDTNPMPPALPPLLPCHNLPKPHHTVCIGREKEIAQLLEFLSPYHPASRISVEGVGGVGKTTLVLEAARCCLDASCWGIGAFDAIIFTSAQSQLLAHNRILPRLKRTRTTSDILRAIANTLNCDITHATTLEELIDPIQDILRCHRTLLIVDNLETIEDLDYALSFLYELPPTVKAVVTSRSQAQLDFSLQVLPLAEADGKRLIQYQAKEKKVDLSDAESEKIYQHIGGIPAAIVYIIGQLRAYQPLDAVLSQFNCATDDITRFLFESSLQLVRGKPSHYLLMALAMFRKPALIGAIVHVALPEAEPSAIAKNFAQLLQLSLVIDSPLPPLVPRLRANGNERDKGWVEKRYDMLPLTRGYVLAELESQYPDFSRSARERWISWYLQFSQEYGTLDEKEWNQYNQLEAEWENLQDAIEWCIDNHLYHEFLQFWRNIRSYSHAEGYYSRDRLIYWHTRLDWTHQLIQAAQQRGDLSTAAEVMFDRGWTIALMGEKRLEEAKTLFAQAWKLRNDRDLPFQINLAIRIAYLRLNQQKFYKARRWLNLSQKILIEHQRSQPTATRQLISILYYEGEICFKTGDYDRAKTFYQQALEKAQSIGWKRAVSLTQNWLADIDIEQGNLDSARIILEECLRVARDNKDKCRTAFCKRSIFLLEKASGNLAAARRWADEALAEFNSLGLTSEAEEIRSWL